MLRKFLSKFIKEENIINFYCIKCKIEFDCDVGFIDFKTKDGTPKFRNPVICPKCKIEYRYGDDITDKFELTEWGQTQLTDLFMR